MKFLAHFAWATLPLLMGTSVARAQGVLDCQRHYEARANMTEAKLASDCYLAILESRPSDPVQLKAAYEGAFFSTAWVYSRTSNYLDKLPMALRGLEISTRLLDADENSAIGLYWNAVFLTLQCELHDAGSLIRGCFLATRHRIFDQLLRAMEIDPRTHGYGPHRAYGTMMRELPLLAGGNRTVSERYLREALVGDPSYSVNYVEYAKTLLELRRTSEARVVLEQLTEYDCMTMNPFRALECADDQAEASKMIERLPSR